MTLLFNMSNLNCQHHNFLQCHMILQKSFKYADLVQHYNQINNKTRNLSYYYLVIIL